MRKSNFREVSYFNFSLKNQKRGQFFLLAAVIISAIVLSMGITANYARINKEPLNFYDFSFEVKKEAGGVINYEVYNKFNDGANLTEFVKLLAGDIRDKDYNANFMFIYGDNSSLTVENYGADVAQIFQEGSSTPINGGSLSINSTISYGGNNYVVYNQYDSLGGTGANATFSNLGSDASITVKILKNDFTFPISQHRQVIFLMQKEEGNEAFISVK
ncbi:MAG: hypothetical protein NUV97_01895 [archaeon]|nr:hypothetical protein [archaeon]MCR4323706.1 hypothetical protein [Nanoarchaeota archaeon]